MNSGMGKLLVVQSVVPKGVLETLSILRFYTPRSVGQPYVKFAMDGIMNNVCNKIFSKLQILQETRNMLTMDVF